MTPSEERCEPGDILDGLHSRTTLSDAEIAETLDDLIARHDPDVLADALLPRLGDLSGPRGEVMMALVEGLSRPELFTALADSLELQSELRPDLAWMALEILEGTGLIEDSAALSTLREELEDALAEDSPLSELAMQIEDDPDSIPLAVAALSRIEPEIRQEIIDGLSRERATPALLDLLGLLAEADHLRARETSACAPAIASEGGGWTGGGLEGDSSDPAGPRLVASLVGPPDADGRGSIVIVSEGIEGHVYARLDCDVRDGRLIPRFEAGLTREEALHRLEEAAEAIGPHHARDCHASARRLLAGSAWLSGAGDEDEVLAKLRGILGETFEPRAVFADPGKIKNAGPGDADPSDDADAVLSRRPSWRDDSELARGLAVEMRLREDGSTPDPEVDSGPFRVLFEGRILGRIELYRRMLLWTAMVWEEAGESSLSRAAMRIAADLADPQNAVPGYPFLESLMVRSLKEGGGR